MAPDGVRYVLGLLVDFVGRVEQRRLSELPRCAFRGFCRKSSRLKSHATIPPTSYERAAITEWLATHDSAPTTNKKMTVDSLVPNRALVDAIERWCTQHNVPVPQKPAAFPSPA